MPCYRGSETLSSVVAELNELTLNSVTPGGVVFRVSEIILVWDNGPGDTHLVIQDLAASFPWVIPVWLSRNFGQHAATLAGVASSKGEWIVTIDEDGQHDPAFIPRMIDVALANQSHVVYAKARHHASHSRLRNLFSSLTKMLVSKPLTGGLFSQFSSFRLIHGDLARKIADSSGAGIYLDVALSWVVSNCTTLSVTSRVEGRPAHNYSMKKLASHFFRLVLTSGTRPLTLVSWVGFFFISAGAALSLWAGTRWVQGDIGIDGWTSLFILVNLIGGTILFSIGITAQYIGVATSAALGRPLYFTLNSPFVPAPPRQIHRDKSGEVTSD